MKTINLLVILAILWGISAFNFVDKKETRAKKQLEMAQLIERGRFRFVARSAHSDLGEFNNLSPNYDMEFDSLNIKAYLPYYGRAYRAKYADSNGGVKFNLTAQKIDIKYNERKKIYTLNTDLKDVDESYTIFLSAGLDGFADLRISFLNRQWISYYGTIEKIEKTER